MSQITAWLWVLPMAVLLGCSGQEPPPYDSSPLGCYQPGMYELRLYCGGPTLSDEEVCPEGDVRINCSSVFVDSKPNPPTTIEHDRCANDAYIQSICGEVILCSIATNGTVYPLCFD